MKIVKLNSIIAFCIICCLSLLSSCSHKIDFPYYCEKERIVSVELVDVGLCYERNVFRASYPVEDIEAFISDFDNITCYHISGYSDIESNARVVKITYNTGEYQVIGSKGEYRHIPTTGETIQQMPITFDVEQFAALIAKYYPTNINYEICEYSLLNDESEIEKIQIVEVGSFRSTGMKLEVVSVVADVDVEAFLDDFRKVECRTGGNPRPEENSKIILITYKNGEYEYIGAEGYVEFTNEFRKFSDQEDFLSGTDCQCFNKEQFAALIEKYSPPEE